MAEITRLRRAASETLEPVKSSKGAKPSRHVQKTTESSAESIDPVCGMTVDTANARYTTVFEEKPFYFCCSRCKEAFERTPDIYLKSTVV